MKKIMLFLLCVLSTLSLGKEAEYTQKEMLKKLRPELKKSRIYEKFREIEARKAKQGEEIHTITDDGLETKNVANEGDYIVRNTTKAKEMYIVKKSKFEKRYLLKEELEDNWARYKPIGKIKAVEVDERLMKKLNVTEEFYFIAAWGQEMVVKKGDYLVSPLDYSETYRIARKEFFETYE